MYKKFKVTLDSVDPIKKLLTFSSLFHIQFDSSFVTFSDMSRKAAKEDNFRVVACHHQTAEQFGLASLQPVSVQLYGVPPEFTCISDTAPPTFIIATEKDIPENCAYLYYEG